MMKMNLQFFAHKKGVGSTKNGQTAWNKDSPWCERRTRRR